MRTTSTWLAATFFVGFMLGVGGREASAQQAEASAAAAPQPMDPCKPVEPPVQRKRFSVKGVVTAVIDTAKRARDHAVNNAACVMDETNSNVVKALDLSQAIGAKALAEKTEGVTGTLANPLLPGPATALLPSLTGAKKRAAAGSDSGQAPAGTEKKEPAGTKTATP